MNAVPKLLPWIGSKSRLADKILPLFPPHACYVEPFAGSAALFFRKEPTKVEVLNDINGDLVNLYRVVKHHLEEFIRQFRWALISRENWQKLAATKPETLTDIQRAARFYYLQRQGFGGVVPARAFGTATTSAPKLNLLRLEEDLSAAHLRLSSTYIEQLPWDECVRRYDRPHTLFYIDPPYWGTEGYGVAFDLAEYLKISDLLRNLKGKAVISVNDIPEMRKAFREFNFQSISHTYITGRANRAPAKELVIRSW